jgi:predicted nucleic acid-binding protein
MAKDDRAWATLIRKASVTDLDANFLITALRGESDAVKSIERWMQGGETIGMSAVAWSEFLCGPLLPGDLERARTFVTHLEPFTPDDAGIAADLFNQTGRRQRSHHDCMIAACAIRRSAPFATSNRADFRRFRQFGLKLA